MSVSSTTSTYPTRVAALNNDPRNSGLCKRRRHDRGVSFNIDARKPAVANLGVIKRKMEFYEGLREIRRLGGGKGAIRG